MSTTQVVLLVVVLLVVAALVALALRARKRKGLQQKFGPEYDRTVEGSDDRRQAERELRERAERRDSLDIRPLEPGARDAFAAEWRDTQEHFVDAPGQAVKEADLLVARVMQQRGYPVGDFDQMARDVSVDHAHVVEEYRTAHDISERNDRQQASTEDLRQAMVHYRSLFSDLLDERGHDGDRQRSR